MAAKAKTQLRYASLPMRLYCLATLSRCRIQLQHAVSHVHVEAGHLHIDRRGSAFELPHVSPPSESSNARLQGPKASRTTCWAAPSAGG